MDIFAHGLWTAAAAVGINRKTKLNLNAWRTGLWGIFPDFFAFVPMVIWIIYQLLFGTFNFADFHQPAGMEPMQFDTLPIFQLTHLLYSFSHSLIIFALIFILVTTLRRRPSWEMGGWLFHILIDIPSHSYKFFPTPVLWPISHWMFGGISWATPWFMVVNYSALAVVYIILFLKRQKD